MEQRTKVCPRCEEAKSWEDFHLDRQRGRPGPYCKPCFGAYKRERYISKTPSHALACKQCGRVLSPPSRSSRAKVFCDKPCRMAWHNAQQTREYRRDSALRATYGIGLTDYEALCASQEGQCRVCGAAEAKSRKGVFDVDHDHKTGRVRGLLCHRCNWALGILGDDPALLRRAADYIEGPTF